VWRQEQNGFATNDVTQCGGRSTGTGQEHTTRCQEKMRRVITYLHCIAEVDIYEAIMRKVGPTLPCHNSGMNNQMSRGGRVVWLIGPFGPAPLCRVAERSLLYIHTIFPSALSPCLVGLACFGVMSCVQGRVSSRMVKAGFMQPATRKKSHQEVSAAADLHK